MDCRQGFQLRFPLALWSASLALFSEMEQLLDFSKGKLF